MLKPSFEEIVTEKKIQLSLNVAEPSGKANIYVDLLIIFSTEEDRFPFSNHSRFDSCGEV